jgi:hypothetical protein
MSKSAALRLVRPMTHHPYVRPAVVVETDDGRPWICLEDGDIRVPAVVAVAGAPPLRPGDRVLVSGEDLEVCYVIGILGEAAPERSLTTRSGASVAVTSAGGLERIEVRDPEDRLLFAYQPETGQGTLSMPKGNLALHAPEGDIELVSGGSVRCQGGKGVALSAGTSSMTLGRTDVSLSSDQLKLASASAQILFAEASYHGVRFSATVEHARLIVKKLESVVVWLFERARSVFRRVEDLHQLEAGRTRTVVQGTHFVKGKRTVIEAEDDVKLDGRRIHLG